jgi:hypothetical protein
MSQTFNFKQSQEILQVDPKTFSKWLKQAGIDPSKQVNLADPREKFLTEEQILMLARDHGREVHFPTLDQETEPTPPAAVILTTVDERLAVLEQMITQRFDQVEAQLRTAIAVFQHDPVKPVQTTSSPQEQVKLSPKTTPIRTTVRKPAKRRAKSKELPKTLVPLSIFKTEHGISNKAVEYALEKQKFTVRRGKWVHNNKSVILALNQQGQHEFYELFYERPGFQRCNTCPHTL